MRLSHDQLEALERKGGPVLRSVGSVLRERAALGDARRALLRVLVDRASPSDKRTDEMAPCPCAHAPGGVHSFSWRHAGQPCHYCDEPPRTAPACAHDWLSATVSRESKSVCLRCGEVREC